MTIEEVISCFGEGVRKMKNAAHTQMSFSRGCTLLVWNGINHSPEEIIKIMERLTGRGLIRR